MRRAHDLYFHRGARFDNKLASTILNEERRVLRLGEERASEAHALPTSTVATYSSYIDHLKQKYEIVGEALH